MNPHEHSPAGSHAERAHETESELLHICRSCESDLVYPLHAEREATGHWWTLLCCPNCDAGRIGLFTNQAVQALFDELDHGEILLLCALERIARENMTDAVELFIRALNADLILPSDF